MDVAPLYMPMGLPPSFNFPRRGPPMPSMMVRPELVKQGNQARYKTELCRAFQDKGVCKYGEKCQVLVCSYCECPSSFLASNRFPSLGSFYVNNGMSKKFFLHL
jgi:hypothetical protein